jgi:hypothetical protein
MTAVWLLGSLALALFAALAFYLAPLEPGVLALQLTFSPRTFGEIVHLWPPQDLARYRHHLLADFVLLGLYGAFGYLFAMRARVFAAAPRALRMAAAVALPLAALFDATENVLHWWLTEVPRFGVPHLYQLSASASLLKWLLILGFGVLVTIALWRDGS